LFCNLLTVNFELNKLQISRQEPENVSSGMHRCSLSPVETIRNCVHGDATLPSPSDPQQVRAGLTESLWPNNRIWHSPQLPNECIIVQVSVRGDTVRHTGDKAPGNKESKTQSGRSVPEGAQQAQSVGLEVVTISPDGLKNNSGEAPFQTVHALAVELAAARSRAAMLAEENERLMELSSKLRFEWERAFTTKFQKHRAPLQLISQEFCPSPACHWQAAMECLPSYLQRPAPCLPCQPQAPRRACHVCCHVGLQWQDRADACKENNIGTEIHEVGDPPSSASHCLSCIHTIFKERPREHDQRVHTKDPCCK
jgi:hypothetical protein